MGDDGQPACRTLRDIGVIARRVRTIVPVGRRLSLLDVHGRLPLDDYGRGRVNRVARSPPPRRAPPKAAADKDARPDHMVPVESVMEDWLPVEPGMECATGSDNHMPMEARLSRAAHPRVPNSCCAEEKCYCHYGNWNNPFPHLPTLSNLLTCHLEPIPVVPPSVFTRNPSQISTTGTVSRFPEIIAPPWKPRPEKTNTRTSAGADVLWHMKCRLQSQAAVIALSTFDALILSIR